MSESKKHWDNIYKDKLAEDVSWFQPKPGLSLELINRKKLTLQNLLSM